MRAIIGAVTALAALSPAVVSAVEDGQGTNVVRSLRATEAIELGGERIASWNEIPGTDLTELESATNALNARVGNLESATNALNDAVNAETTARENADAALQDNINAETLARENADSALESATNVLNTRVGNLESATNALNDAVNAETTARENADIALQDATNSLNGRVGSLETATNALDSSVNALNARTNDWNMAVYTPGSQQIPDNNTTVSVARAVAKIGNDGSPVSFSDCEKSIAAGSIGQFLTVICTNDAPIKFSNGKGVILAEGVSFSMNSHDVIQLVYDGANWVEVHRTDN
ncbi:MAG: hypothetical protein PHP98_04615 [Kiritimatiellae bacterium]|nr:hypothetical protein [Kiritimatiellia bacterium]